MGVSYLTTQRDQASNASSNPSDPVTTPSSFLHALREMGVRLG